MTVTRRDFVRTAAALGMAGAAGTGPFLSGLLGGSRGSDRSLRILVLGGTGFIGPYQVRYAVKRGHTVSVFNRGRRKADLPASVEHLRGDRNGDLEALRGREWDVVIDNPTVLPVWVRDAASLLRDHVDRYVFISTISVLADNDRPGRDETARMVEYGGDDPLAEDLVSLRANPMGLYGSLKAASEREAERWLPGRTTVIRPGLIVGPGDPTDRFTYWPVRVARGGEVLAPGTPEDPVQVIDARDLSEWTIRAVEQGTTGIFHAVGPERPLGIGTMLEAMRPLAERDVRFTFVDADFLASQQVRPWMDLPTWVPPHGETAGFSNVDNRRAVDRGLTFRPIGDTARDTLRWFRTLPEERRTDLRAGLSADREAEVLRAWHERDVAEPPNERLGAAVPRTLAREPANLSRTRA